MKIQKLTNKEDVTLKRFVQQSPTYQSSNGGIWHGFFSNLFSFPYRITKRNNPKILVSCNTCKSLSLSLSPSLSVCADCGSGNASLCFMYVGIMGAPTIPAWVWFTLKTFVHVNELNDVFADVCACGWKWKYCRPCTCHVSFSNLVIWYPINAYSIFSRFLKVLISARLFLFILRSAPRTRGMTFLHQNCHRICSKCKTKKIKIKTKIAL